MKPLAALVMAIHGVPRDRTLDACTDAMLLTLIMRTMMGTGKT